MILKYMMLTLDCVVLITLIAYILRGLISGTAKTLSTTGVKWILILILLIFSEKIAETIITISYVNFGSIQEVVVSEFSTATGMNLAQDSYQHTYELVCNLTICITRLAVIMVGLILINLVIYPIISLILMICGVRKSINKIGKPLLSRLGGVVLSVIAFVGIFIIIYMPIYGTMAFSATIMEDVKILEENLPTTEEENTQNLNKFDYFSYPQLDNTTDQVEEIIEGYNSSLIYRMLKNDQGKMNIAEKYVDSLITIKTKNGKIKMIAEYYNFREVFPIIAQASQTEDKLYLSVSDVNILLKVLQETKLIGVALPISVEFLISNQTFEKYNIDASKLVNVNWHEEIKCINDILAKSVELYEVVVEYQDDYKAFLGDDRFVVIVPELVDLLYQLDMIQEIGLDYADVKVDELIEEKYSENEIGRILALIELKENIVGDVENACKLLNNAYKLGIVTQEINEIDFTIPEKTSILETMITQVFDFSFIKGNEKELIMIGLDALEAEKYIDVETLEMDTINWNTEPVALASIVGEYLKLIDGNDVKDFQVAITKDNNDQLIEALTSSTIFTNVLLPVVDGIISQKLVEEELLELADIIKFSSLSNADLTAELKKLVQIIRDLETLGVMDGNIQLTDEDTICDLLQQALSLKIIGDDQAVIITTLLDYAGLTQILADAGIVIDTSNVDWDQEAIILSKLIVQINNLDSTDLSGIINNVTTENQVEISNLLKTILQVQIIQKSFPMLISDAFEKEGLADWTSEWLTNQKTNFVEDEWLDQIDKILDLVVYYQTEGIDLGSLTVEKVSTIKALLEKMLEIKLFSLNPLIGLMNTELQTYVNTTKNYLTIPDTIQWSTEVEILLGENGIYPMLMAFNDETTFKQYGILLDIMLKSSIISGGFYEFVGDYIKTLSVYEQGILTDADISQDNLELVTSWENELELIDRIDLNSDIQSGETLDLIMQSVLLRRQITVYVINIINDQGLGEYYSENEITSDLNAVNKRIDDGKITIVDTTDDWSWAKEINAIQEFSVKLDLIITNLESSNPPSNDDIQELKMIANTGTITKKILERVCERYPQLAILISLN